jgi:hypothetical protein
MALGSTQPLTEMSTRNLPEGKGRPERVADNLSAIREPIVKKMWEPRRLTTSWASTASYLSHDPLKARPFFIGLLTVKPHRTSKELCPFRLLSLF